MFIEPPLIIFISVTCLLNHPVQYFTFSGRVPSVLGLYGEGIGADGLPVQEPVHDEVQHQTSVLVPLSRQTERILSIPRDYVVALGVENTQIRVDGRGQPSF